MAKLYLVRHADAGHRSGGSEPDELRPLSARGERQAAGLVDLLGELPITRLLSSPYLRCRQSLEPLGLHLGLKVEEEPRLAEGTPVADVLDLVDGLAGTSVALCSHGDVIPDLLDALLQRGARFKDELRWQKASTWVLTWDDGRLSKGRYLPPPS